MLIVSWLERCLDQLKLVNVFFFWLSLINEIEFISGGWREACNRSLDFYCNLLTGNISSLKGIFTGGLFFFSRWAYFVPYWSWRDIHLEVTHYEYSKFVCYRLPSIYFVCNLKLYFWFVLLSRTLFYIVCISVFVDRVLNVYVYTYIFFS